MFKPDFLIACMVINCKSILVLLIARVANQHIYMDWYGLIELCCVWLTVDLIVKTARSTCECTLNPLGTLEGGITVEI